MWKRYFIYETETFHKERWYYSPNIWEITKRLIRQQHVVFNPPTTPKIVIDSKTRLDDESINAILTGLTNLALSEGYVRIDVDNMNVYDMEENLLSMDLQFDITNS